MLQCAQGYTSIYGDFKRPDESIGDDVAHKVTLPCTQRYTRILGKFKKPGKSKKGDVAIKEVIFSQSSLTCS